MDITALIPQRRPFLFIDNIVESTQDQIITEVKFGDNYEFFKGHFPGNPIVPGVILNEHCFQSAAALINLTSKEESHNQLAVVSRIQSAKFKNIVRPNEVLRTKTELKEKLANAAYFKSIITKENGEKALIIEFACTMVEN